MKIPAYFVVGLILFSGTAFGQANQILFEGCICYDSASVNQSLNWYALVKSDNKTFHYSLKQVKISLETGKDCEFDPLKITTNLEEKSRYLIGTTKAWKEKEIYTPHNWNRRTRVDVTKTDLNVYSIDLKNHQASTFNEMYRYGDDEFKGFAIIGKTNSGRDVAQELQGNFEFDIIKKYGLYLDWFGDLDGDNKADVILWTQTDGEGGTYYFLFLTSEAKEDEVIGKAGETNIGKCN